MGYGYYTREIDGLERHMGYAIVCECDYPECHEVIDRGLSYVCGGEPGECNEHGCGRYFCGKHLFLGWADKIPQLCERCRDFEERRKAEGEDAEIPFEPWPMKPDLPNALEFIEWDTPEAEAEGKALSEKSRTASQGRVCRSPVTPLPDKEHSE